MPTPKQKIIELAKLCESLLQTADGTGCTPDLTVVSKGALDLVEDFVVNYCGVEEV